MVNKFSFAPICNAAHDVLPSTASTQAVFGQVFHVKAGASRRTSNDFGCAATPSSGGWPAFAWAGATVMRFSRMPSTSCAKGLYVHECCRAQNGRKVLIRAWTVNSIRSKSCGKDLNALIIGIPLRMSSAGGR